MTTPADRTVPTGVLDEALDRLSIYSYTDGPGMATHGPMGAEALVCLGYDDQVATWVEEYKARHEPIDGPGPVGRLDPDDPDSWRPALGDPTRLADWRELFTRAVDDEPWPDVLRTWVPRLLPGYGGAFTHGLIRTSHAVRAVERQWASGPSPLALRELATALSYWAGTYLPLPGHPGRPSRSRQGGQPLSVGPDPSNPSGLRGDLPLDEALRRVPRPDQAWNVMEAAQFTRLGELAAFPDAVAAHAPPTSVDDALSDLTSAFARFMVTTDAHPIGLVHAVTPVAGTRVLLPYLPEGSHAEVYASLWQVSAAIVAGFVPPEVGPGTTVGPAAGEDDAEPAPAAELAARAVEHKDPHVVKYTAACLGEHRLRPDPHFLVAAQRVIERLPGW